MQTLYYPTVIIGSGLAARIVASHLEKGTFCLLERGENRDLGDFSRRFKEAQSQGMQILDAERYAYQSQLPHNALPALSRWCYSTYAMVRGGSSNWWGGKSLRIPDETFSCDSALPWALSAREIRPWYERAERTLNVAGDPLNPRAPAPTAIPGASYWRNAFAGVFGPTYVDNTAYNHRAATATQGKCVGRGHCAVCEEDSKARPDNLFEEVDAQYEAMVMELEFDGDKAVAAHVYDGKQLYRVTFDRLVIAAGGIETARVLGRSTLPSGVNKGSLGRFFQDHAHLMIHCRTNRPLPYRALGSLAHVTIEEYSKLWDSPVGQIGVQACAVTHEPDAAAWRAAFPIGLLDKGDPQVIIQHLKGCFTIYAELETTAEIDARVDLESDEPHILDENYARLIPEYDRITASICDDLRRRGVDVYRVDPAYQGGYGGHHFSGTVNWSKGPHNMMESDLRLGGTSNVYIAGSAVIPKSAGVGPTLTVAALSERLGVHLKNESARRAAAE